MTDILRARRSRGALPESEDDDYSDSESTLTSNEDGYSTQDSAEDTSDYDTESDEYGATETDEEFEQEAAVVEQETSQREEEDPQPMTPEQSKYSTLPPVVEHSSSPNKMVETNVPECTTHEPQINSDNNQTSPSLAAKYNETQPTVVEQAKEMIPQEQEQETYEKAPTAEEGQNTQQQHVVEQHNEHQEEYQQTVTTDTNEQPTESMAETESESLKDPQEKRIQEHREYRRKLAEDPSFVPYVGLFWSHDDRYREDSLTETRQSPAFPAKPSQSDNAPQDRRADPLMNKRWDHGGYEELLRMEQEDEKHKHDRPEQDPEQHDTQPNRQHFNRPRPPRERPFRYNNSSNAHQPKEEWPVVSNTDAQIKDEKTDVANASWATVTVDDLEEHGKPVNRKSNWNDRKASYNNGNRDSFRRDSNYKTQHNSFDKRGQSSFRDNRYKQFNKRTNSDTSRNQNSDIESTRLTRQLSKNFGGWGDDISNGNTSQYGDTNNSTPTPELDKQSEKPGWTGEPINNAPSTTGWNEPSSDSNNHGWGNEPTATAMTETGESAVPAAEKANTGWSDFPSIKENAGANWTDLPKTDNHSNNSNWSPKTSNVGWDKGADMNNKSQLEQNHASPVKNDVDSGWNHVDRVRINSNDNKWKNKEIADNKPRSGWNSPQKELGHHRKQSPSISKSSDANIENEMAAAQWSQPAVTVNIDLSTAIGNGWGEGAVIVSSDKSDGLDKPVATIDLAAPAISANVLEVNGWSQGSTSTEKPASGWDNSSSPSPSVKTPTIDNASTDKASGWSSADIKDKNASGWNSSAEQVTDKDKSIGWTSAVVDGEKVVGWGSSVEQTVNNEKIQGWGSSPPAVKSQSTSGWKKPETAENKENPVGWDDSTAVASTEKSPIQESVGWSEGAKTTFGWNETHDAVEKDTKEVELPKAKINSQEETGRKENASTSSTLNASANGWTGSDKSSSSPSWTPNMNWGARNELSGRKGYLSQKTEAHIVKAETIELPIDTRMNPMLHGTYEDDSDVEIILEDDDTERFNNEPVLGISAPERPAITVDEPWEKKAPTHHFMTTDDYAQQPPNMPMYYTSQIHPNGAVAYVPVHGSGPNSSPMFIPYSMGMPTSPAMGTSSPNSGGVSPHKYYSPIPGPSVLHPPPGYEANGMVYYGVGPSAMYPPQQYYYMSAPSGEYMEDDGEGWGPAPEAPEIEEEWSKEPYSQPSNVNYPQSYYYYY